ncbi:MAG: ester cyclase [Anaerolineales bacterium]|nr:ester cyclase [Anaerolineales bacterium]
MDMLLEEEQTSKTFRICRCAQDIEGKPMQLSDDFEDAVDFIKQSLSEIWDRKQIGKIYDVYQHNAQVHTPDGDLYGREDIIRSATFRLAAFPNIRCSIEDVVWGRNEREGGKVAVRWTMVGRNTGHSIYALPTGHEATWRGISHYLVRDGRIVEEWVVDNELSVIRQLGLNESELVAELASSEPLSGDQAYGYGEIERVFGQTTPEVLPPKTTEGFAPEDLVQRSTHEIWNWRLVGKVDDVYAEDYRFHGPSDRILEGRDEFRAYVLSMLAAFPDLAMHVDDLFWIGNGRDGYRTTMRWTLLGTHEGPSIYGAPTGKRVRVHGITNHVVKGGNFVEEWTEFGEFALLKQLYTPDQASVEAGEGTEGYDQDGRDHTPE